MPIHSDIDELLYLGINIIKDEILSIQLAKPLSKSDSDKLTEYLKTLITIRKDWRLAEKEQSVDAKSMTDEELEAALLAEAEKIKGKNAKA